MNRAFQQGEAVRYGMLAVQMADIYRDSCRLESEISVLQSMQHRPPVVVKRLVERCCEVEMWQHARFYLDPPRGRPEILERAARQVEAASRPPTHITGDRLAVWKFLRSLALIRILRIEQKYQRSFAIMKEAQLELDANNLNELAPWLHALMALACLHTGDMNKAGNCLKYINYPADISMRYPLLSGVYWQGKYLYVWPEVIFVRGVSLFCKGKFDEARKKFNEIKENFAWYASTDEEMVRLVNIYVDAQPNWNNQEENDKWLDVIGGHVNRLIAILLVRGLMNGIRQRGDDAVALKRQIVEDLVNLEITPYMIHFHLGACLMQQEEYQQAIEHLTLARKLLAQDAPVYLLGQIAAQNGYRPEAIAFFEYCHRYPPVGLGIPNIRDEIGTILQQLKEK